MAIIKKLLIIPILGLSFYFNFSGIDWGLPSKERSLLVFGSMKEIEKLTPILIKTREDVYKVYDKWKIYQPSDNEVFINSMRGFLLQTEEPDSAKTYGAIARINPEKLDFNPNFFTYGGAYLYSIGFLLFLAKSFGILNISDLSSCFLNPDEVGKIHIIGRSLGAISNIGSTYIIYLIGSSYFSTTIGLLSALFFALSPTMILFSHISKPHIFATFLGILGIFFALRIIEKPKVKNYFLASFFIGLSMGASFVNFLLLPLPLIACFLKKIFKFKHLFLPLFSIFIFFSTNPYSILSFEEFYNRTIVFHATTGGNELDSKMRKGGYVVPEIEKVSSFFNELTENITPFAIPLFLLGLYCFFKFSSLFKKLVFFSLCLLTPGVMCIGYLRIVLLFLPISLLVLASSIELFSGKKGIIIKLLFLLNLVFLIHNSFLLNLDFKGNNFISAGRWINKNIPKQSLILLVDKYTPPCSCPPFSLPKYKLKKIGEDFEDKEGYIIIVERGNVWEKEDEIKKSFKKLTLVFKRSSYISSAIFLKRNIEFPNPGIKIYRFSL
ncbi:MAG: glycosyltransferase family 39 protein [bacterium]